MASGAQVQAPQHTRRKDFVGSAFASHRIRGSASGNKKQKAHKILPSPAGSGAARHSQAAVLPCWEGTAAARKLGLALLPP